MCLLIVLLFGGPRLVSIVWYLADQARWNATFDGILIPILGFLFLPWTMVMYVLVFPGIEGFEIVLLGLGVLADVLSWGGSAWQGNKRRYGYKTQA
ncbi:MAG TPA: hypothetical protein VJ839_08290 [Candidatus Limnocylindria bacterium]|nr:hypothetical protein [Candidatus Limnocylindria bacterium]